MRYYGVKLNIGFSTNLYFSDISAHNCPFDCTNHHEWRLHDAPHHCNRRKQWANLHIWSNLTCFFRSLLFWMFPFEWLDFGFNVIAIDPWLIASYDFFEQILVKVQRCQHVLNVIRCIRCFSLKFSNIGTICKIRWGQRYANII